MTGRARVNRAPADDATGSRAAIGDSAWFHLWPEADKRGVVQGFTEQGSVIVQWPDGHMTAHHESVLVVAHAD